MRRARRDVESRLKILIIILVLAALGAGGYFGYNYYQNKKTNSVTPTATATPEGPAYQIAMGTVTESSAEKVVIKKEDGANVEFVITKDTIIRKIGENFEYTETSVDDISKDRTVLVVYLVQDDGTNNAMKIDIIN